MPTEEENKAKETELLEKTTKSREKELQEIDKMRKQYAKLILGVEDATDEFQSLSRGLGYMSGRVIGQVTSGFLQVAQGAMASGDAFAAAGAGMKMAVDTVNTGVQVGAQALMSAGEDLKKAGKPGGAALVAVGQTASVAANALASLAKTGIDFMISQTGKMIASYQKMGQAGAIYAGGLTAMTKTAQEGGMTLEQMSAATAANTDALTRSGLGVSAGSKRMAEAMAAGGKEARQGMFALGMNMEEQADAYATTMQRMAGPMGKLNASNAEVAAQTEQYARDLKLISDLTGKSAKEQQAQADAATSSMRMQIELQKMDPKARADFMDALQGMTKESTAAIQDRMAHFGTVTDKTTAVMESVSPSLKKMHEEEYQLAKAGKLTAEKEMELRAKYGEQINKEMGNQEALANAAASSGTNLGDLSARAGELMKENSKVHEKGVKEAEERIKQQQQAGKDGKDVGANLQQTQQDFALKLQQIAMENLPQFSKALESYAKIIGEAVGFLGKGGGGLFDFLNSLGGIILAAVVPALIGVATGAMMRGGGAKGVVGTAAEIAGGGGGGAGKAAQGVGAGIGEGLSGIGKGIASIGEGAGKAIGGILKGLADGLSALGNPKVLLGTVSLVGVGAAMFVAGKGFQQFQGLDWESIAKGLVGLGAAGLGAAALGALAVPMALGAAALVLVSAATWGFGAAIKTLPDNIAEQGEAIGQAIKAMWDAPIVRMGSAGAAALAAIGTVGLLPLSLGLTAYKAAGGIGTLATDMQTIQSLDPDKLKEVAKGIAAIKEAQSPSFVDMAKNAVAGAFDKLAGGGDKSSDSPGAKPPANDLLTAVNNLAKLSAEQINQQKQMLTYLRDHGETSKKILHATQ